MPESTYQRFRRAVDYLTGQGFSVDRLLSLAETYGYEGFANLAPPRETGVADGVPDPPPQPDVNGYEGGGESGQSGNFEGDVYRVPDDASLNALDAYFRNEGVDERVRDNLLELLTHVQDNAPPLDDVVDSVLADIRRELYNVKHWMVALAALSYDEFNSEQASRRFEAQQTILEALRDKGPEDAVWMSSDEAEITEAFDKILTVTDRIDPTHFGEWAAESLSVQPWQQAAFGFAADWIELEQPAL